MVRTSAALAAMVSVGMATVPAGGQPAEAPTPVDLRLNGLAPDQFRDQNPEYAITYVAPQAARSGGIDYVPASVLESWYQLPMLTSTDSEGRRVVTFRGKPRTGQAEMQLVCTEGSEGYTIATAGGAPQELRLPPGARSYVNEYGDLMLPALPLVRAIGGRAYAKGDTLHIEDGGASVVAPVSAQPTAAVPVEATDVVVPPPEVAVPPPVATLPETGVIEETLQPTPMPIDYFIRQDVPRVFPDGESNPTAVVLRRFDIAPEVVSGSTTTVRMVWAYRPDADGQIDARQNVCISLLGNWEPLRPLALLVEGEPQGPPRTESKTVEIEVPEEPGEYRLRWVLAYAFAPVTSFYGDVKGGLWSPGVGPYGEIAFRVVPAAPAPEPTATPTQEPATGGTRDWFETSGVVRLLPPRGTNTTTVSIEAFDVPGVVEPGQNVMGRIDWTFQQPPSGKYDDRAPVHVRVFGDWLPNEPLVNLMNGVEQGRPRSVRKFFRFRAPSDPGRYRLRWIVSVGEPPVTSYFGSAPTAFAPGVSPYAEVEFDVK